MRREKVPKYWLTMFFTELEDLVKLQILDEYDHFRFYNQDLNSKFRYLELIYIRYKEDKKNWNHILERVNKFRENLECLSQDELQKESQELGKKTISYSTALVLDIDSFFIFSKILLDRIPYLIRYLCEGIVSNQDIKVYSFTHFVDWFMNNPEFILDPAFSDEMISFGQWFKKNLKYPRDKIIVHPALHTISSIIKYDAQLERKIYELRIDGEEKIWRELNTLEMPDINVILKKIVELLNFLNKYFYEKLLMY